MKKLLILFFSLIGILLFIKSVNATSKLHVEGRWIKNETGHTIVLRGINKHGFEDSPTAIWQTPEGGIIYEFDPDIVAANFNAMKSWGINTARMYSTAQYWIENTSGHREIVKQIAQILADREMYLLYTFWHQKPGDPQDVILWPSSTFPNSSAFVNFWVSIAQELKNYSNVIFSLWNEPQYSAPNESEWFSVFQQCIDAIRATGAENLISVEWGGIWVDMDEARKYGVPTNQSVPWAFSMYWVESHPLNDPLNNLLYEFHNYRDSFQVWEGQDYRFPYSIDELKEGYEFALVDYVLYTLNKPVVCGEIGPNMWETGKDLEIELEWYSNALTLFNEKNLNYIAFWWWPTWKHAHLIDGAQNYQPNQAGEILINAIANGTGITTRLTISEKLVDKNNNPVIANVSIDSIKNSTDSEGRYTLTIPMGIHDILFNITNFFIPNFWLKLLSVNISSLEHNKLTHITNYTEQKNISLIFNITGNQTIQLYSPEKPRRVLKNSTVLTEYNSISDLISNYGWFYNQTEKILYIKFN